MDKAKLLQPVRILHLSDFHFSAARAWDSEPILGQLAARIGRDVAERGLEPDLVVITGDLAQSGKPEEYAIAREWLQAQLWPRLRPDPAAPLAVERLLLVPGNHDVDWDRIGADAKATHADILRSQDQDQIAGQLQDSSARDVVLDRHAAYLAFYADWLGHAQPLPWWQRGETIRGQRLHIAGLDSAWLSGGDDDSRLVLGTYQINQTVLQQDADPPFDWRIALLHHPWASFAEFDRLKAQRTLHRWRDLILRGHLHQADPERRVRPDPNKDCIELAAGCCYAVSGRGYPNAFQWIELHRDPCRLRVLFRRWDGDEWIDDRTDPGHPDAVWDLILDRSDDKPLGAAGKGVDDPLCGTLRTARERLGEQHRAALLQSVNALGAADRVRAKTEVEDIEERIREIEAQIAASCRQ